MGLLDKVSKALDTVRDVATRVESAAATAAAENPAVAQSLPAAAESSGIDCGDPRRWLSPAQIADITGVAVGEPVEVDDDDTFGVRFTDTSGTFTVEVRSIREEILPRYGGNPGTWIDEQAARHPEHHVVDRFADYAVTASDGPDQATCFVWCADSCFVASANGPGDVRRVPERLLRRLYDWPEEPETS